MGAMLVAAALIATMRGRVEGLIERLHDAARTDPLTGLQNRRGFRESLDLEIERCRRSGTSMALVVGDLDRFTLVNDEHGHAAGDAALRRVAAVLSDDHRRIDACARVGGEEFALILPDADEHGALETAERLCALVAAEFAGDPVPLTISFGIATFPALAETAGALLRASDEALHAAKHHGRDRSIVHSHGLADRLPARVGPAKEVESERYLATVLDLAEAVDIRFSGSARHCETVGRYAELMARELGLSKQHVARVRLAGVLHDVGKIGIPDAILGKQGPLDDDEWVLMKGHAALGAQILEHPSLADVQSWVGAHHERPDGKGYPHGLSGDALPLEARILAVADAYEAMTADRVYRSALGEEAARAELEAGTGTQFDPRVVEAFIAALDGEAGRDVPAGAPASATALA
jgi:diguanylate cyclase (GGDEF)-like protein/putative nucleotidyltransferase with HDIG domain